MRGLGFKVTIDAIGNIVGVRGGREDLREDLRDHLAPVMLGSHVDTAGTGGANLD
jgi:N-carbamoyl-L-amino-acid hydrolase